MSSMRGWRMARTGEPAEILQLVDLPLPKPGAGEVLVELEYAGVSFADLLLIRGEYQVSLPLPCVPGSEMVGTVRDAGAGATIAPGTRVLGLGYPPNGAYAGHCIAIDNQCEPIPPDLPGPEAVALIGNYVTAQLALHRRARLQPGENVVVLGAAGGVGSAAVQIAKATGAKVLGADLGAERAALCQGVGADVGVDATHPGDLAKAVAEMTGGRGADVVIDVVGGTLFEAVRRFMAYEGRIVIVGFTGGGIPQLRVNQLILRSFGVLGVNALTTLEQYPDVHREARQAVVGLLRDGRVAPQIGGVYPFEQVGQAFSDMAAKKVRGKAILQVA